eukprot:gene20605-27404_t
MRVSGRTEISDELKEDVERLRSTLVDNQSGSDLLITAFTAALKHFKRATIATPFPAELFQTSGNEKDFHACMQAVEQLPALETILKTHLGNSASATAIANSNLASLPTGSRQLLEWLLQPGCPQPAFTDNMMPDFIFKNMAEMPDTKQGTPIIAYHGTSFERLHSIMNVGLLNMSGTKMQRTGANHGSGIYMATDYSVSLTFCQSAIGWRGSTVGHKLRCLLVCLVDRDLASEDRPPDQDENSGEKLPPAYLLVGRTDAIRLQYVLIYKDDVKETKSTKINWCSVIIAAYIAGMLLHHLFNWKAVERWLRHQMRGY